MKPSGVQLASAIRPPAGLRSPMLWGTEAHLRELFGEGLQSLSVTEQTFTFRFASAEEFVAFFRRWYGPTLKAFEAVGADGKGDLETALVELARRHDRIGTGEAIAIPATYAEALGVTR